MMFVSLTRLRIRSVFSLLPFFLLNERAVKQIVDTPGFLSGRLLADRRRTFWTVTAWETEAAMKAYRSSGAHREAMPRLAGWCDEAAVLHWSQESAELPSWLDLWKKLSQDARMSPVQSPSANQLAKQFPEPRTTLGRTLKKR